MGAAEEFFHIFGATTGIFVVGIDTVFELDGADGAERTLVAEDEIDGFVFDEAVSFVAVLEADFVTEEGREVDAGDDIEFLAEEIIKHLEALFLSADHKMFAGAVATAIHSLAVATAGGNAGENRDQKEQ